MSFIENENSIRVIQDICSLDNELEKLVAAVALTERLRLRIFADESKLDEICMEGPFNLKGSGISAFLNLPVPSASSDFLLSVGRAVAWSLSEVGKEIATRPGDRVFGESENRKGTKALSPLELEVEHAIAEAGAFAPSAGEMLLTAALLEDGKVRVFRSDQARSVLEGTLFSRASLLECCECYGFKFICLFERIPDTFVRLFALILSERAQRLRDL